MLLHRYNPPFAALVLAVSPLIPPDGLGFDLCLFKNLTGLPCPGCGLTRSFACLAHLELTKAFRYHPFGPLFFVGAVLMASLLVMGPRRRERIHGWLLRHDAIARPLYLAVVYAFIAYGMIRLGLTILWPGALPPV